MDVCPPFNRFFKPLLVFANTGEVNVAEVAALIADDLNLTIQARSETTKSGKRKRYIDRTQWAATYLRQAGLVRTTKRGFVSITAEGRAFLTAHAGDIIVDNLKTIPAFVDFQQRRRGPNLLHSVHDNTAEDLFTPHDRISQALDEIEDELAMTLLEQLQTATPPFFEKVAVDLLLHMGYGGAQDNAGRVLGQAGDNGIDGVIDQDPLGLERVYLQAKRYESQNKVSGPDIRNFIGSLEFHQANKGLFVTTSSFTPSACETAEKVSQRIVLIDGARLSRLMITFNVGCSTQRQLSLKQLDSDYFE